jgi:magnesium transporter
MRASDLCDSYRDSIASLVEAHLLTTSNRANEAMKVLTVFAAIMLPLTVVTGIYGMNFDWMPELNWKYGYPLTLAIMAAIAGGMIYFFKKKKWV